MSQAMPTDRQTLRRRMRCGARIAAWMDKYAAHPPQRNILNCRIPRVFVSRGMAASGRCHRPAMATCSPASAARPARWASAITGTRPARETRFGSSKRRVDLGQPMQQSHLTGAPSDQVMEASATPIVPGQGAPFASTRRPPSHHLRSGSRLS